MDRARQYVRGRGSTAAPGGGDSTTARLVRNARHGSARITRTLDDAGATSQTHGGGALKPGAHPIRSAAMRICLITRNRFHNDRRALVAYRALARAGHDVQVVTIDKAAPQQPVRATVSSRIGPDNRVVRRLNKLIPTSLTNAVVARRLASAATATNSDIYMPLQRDVLSSAVSAATRTNGMVLRTPGMPSVGDLDLISVAPAHPDRAAPASGQGTAFTPADARKSYSPEPDRFLGDRVVICYRKTEFNPGRYLESALERSGMQVRLETEAIDLTTVDDHTRFIVFVEGPYPEIQVSGKTSVPTFYWAHHGEHHLHPNLRLTDRYRADAVLLAHSWHLAPWFPAPVHRFPFAVASELFSEPRPLRDRSIDVAMVGSKLRGEAWQYRRRSRLVEALESSLDPDRVRFVTGVTPEEMAKMYGDSRIVVNEGGIRHHPITMRVFEAIGAGALLLTDPAPGLEVLFAEDEYECLGEEVTGQVHSLIADLESTQARVDRALRRAMGEHTYDHRVDLLMEIAANTEKRDVPSTASSGALARLIDGDVEVQRLIHDGVHDLEAQLPDREVWPLSERTGRLGPASMDAAVVTQDDIEDLDLFLDTARRFIYVDGELPGVEAYLKSRHPEAVVEQNDHLRRVDLMTESYRVRADGASR